MTSKTKQKVLSQETMEDVLNSVKHACEFTRNLEPELPFMANHPDMLSLSIDEVIKAFSEAKQKLMMMRFSQQEQLTTVTPSSSFVPMLPHDVLKHGTQNQAQTLDQLLLMQQQQPFDVRALLENKMVMSGGDVPQQLRYRDVEGSSERSKEGEMQGIEASPSRPRKSASKKVVLEKRTVMFPAPLVGNTEMPPEDGFTWRKYGQKEILGTKYPRSYYRCTHQKLYACPAKKQVQRLDDNPNIFQVTFRGEHTCHMSSTAPSSYPAPQLLVDISRDMTQTPISPHLSPSSTSVHGWLSPVNLGRHSGGGAGSSSGGGATGSKFGTDYPVADMADAMFNSGSSSGNSMESLFASGEDLKWEAGEKKS